MKIAVISDIHGSIEALELIKTNIMPCIDEAWFLGDLYYDYKDNEETKKNRKIIYEWIKTAVKDKLKIMLMGNCDIKENSDNELFLKEKYLVKSFMNKKFLLVHGHELKDEDKKQLLTNNNCDVLLSGHTHIGDIVIEDDYLFINPGSVSFPRDEANIPTYLILDDEQKKISLFALDNNEIVQELIIY